MKINLLCCLIVLLSVLSPTTTLQAQTGKGLVFNGIDQFVEFPASGFPVGASARTIECWVKNIPVADSAPHFIFSYGNAGAKGRLFGVYGVQTEHTYRLGFSGHEEDLDAAVEIADDGWHFLAITYDGRRLSFYLDGELKADKVLVLNTDSGPVSIGKSSEAANFFKGGIRDLTVWSTSRNQGQIQKDMVQWPTISGKEQDLVAHFPMNEGNGNTFSSKNGKITCKLNGRATWSKPIPDDPDPINEGVWFVIQNKADLDLDTDILARRMAIRVNGHSVAWSAIPLTGDYDAFLWRVITRHGRNYLVNKKAGMTKAMDSNKERPSVQNIGNYSGQHWNIRQANAESWGTNVYTLSNNFAGPNHNLSLEGNDVRFASKNASNTRQAWIMQPMELALGYHLPVSSAGNGPMTQVLEMDYGFKVYASNTVKEWSILNGHLIWKNMLNAIHNTAAIAGLNSKGFTRKELQIISRFDQNTFVAEYPRNFAKGQLIFDEQWYTNYRGGSGNDPRRQLSSTTVTEEMMCRRGTFSRGYNDRSVREFDQIVHEFGHALDKICGMNGGNFPNPTLGGSRTEGIAAAVQVWFNNNNSYRIFARNRAEQRTAQPAHFNRLKTFFREGNSWAPPRWLRNQGSGRVALNNGEVLQASEWIYATTPYGPAGAYAALQPDGNFVVYSNNTRGFKWGSYNALNIPLKRIKTITMENGVLRMKDGSGNNVYSSTNSPTQNAQFVIAAPLPGKPNSWMRIVDRAGNLIWAP